MDEDLRHSRRAGEPVAARERAIAQAQVNSQFTHRAGVGVHVIGTDQDHEHLAAAAD